VEKWENLDDKKKTEIISINDFYCGMHFILGLQDHFESNIKEWEKVESGGDKLGRENLFNWHRIGIMSLPSASIDFTSLFLSLLSVFKKFNISCKWKIQNVEFINGILNLLCLKLVLPLLVENWENLDDKKKTEIISINDFYCGMHFYFRTAT
jgi:hypothetical protein